MCIQSNKKLLYLITIIFIICLSCTTDYDQIWPLDGNRPITLYVDDRLTSALSSDAVQIIKTSASLAEKTWFPSATGAPQYVSLDYDNSGTWHCAENQLMLMWSPRPNHVIYVCPLMVQQISNKTKVFRSLIHELGHQLGAVGHVEQNGRVYGPIMCGWPGCIDPSFFDYQDEDVTFICKYGHGGRCWET